MGTFSNIFCCFPTILLRKKTLGAVQKLRNLWTAPQKTQIYQFSVITSNHIPFNSIIFQDLFLFQTFTKYLLQISFERKKSQRSKNEINHSWKIVIDISSLHLPFSPVSFKYFFVVYIFPLPCLQLNMIILNYMLWWQKAKKNQLQSWKNGFCLMNCWCSSL